MFGRSESIFEAFLNATCVSCVRRSRADTRTLPSLGCRSLSPLFPLARLVLAGCADVFEMIYACRTYVGEYYHHTLLVLLLPLMLLLFPPLDIQVFAFSTLPLCFPSFPCCCRLLRVLFFRPFTPKAPVLTRGTSRGRSLAKTTGRP